MSMDGRTSVLKLGAPPVRDEPLDFVGANSLCKREFILASERAHNVWVNVIHVSVSDEGLEIFVELH